MSDEANTMAQKAQFPMWQDMTDTERLDFLEAAYEHGLYAVVSYGKGYAKGESPNPKILQDAGFLDTTAAEQFSESYTIIDQYDSWTGMSVVAIRNKITGNVAVSTRGTSPTDLRDLLTDGLLAFGVPKELNPQYRALKSKVEEWIEDGTLPPATVYRAKP